MRIVIVGGGVIGLLTAVHCVKDGHEVVLIDQDDIPFPGSASFDRHRVLRALHLADPDATAAAVRARHCWERLEISLSTRFYVPVGALTVLPPRLVPPAQEMLASAGSACRALDQDELRSRYPHVRFPADASAVLEPQAGVLLADQVLLGCATWLRSRAGVELRRHHKAASLVAGRAAVRLADGNVLAGDAMLIAVGPWSRSLLTGSLVAGLALHRQSMIYCQVPDRAVTAWSATPAMLSLGTNGAAWLVPPVAGTPLKLSATTACRVVTQIRGNRTPRHWRDHVTRQFTTVIPGFQAGWITGSADCYYLARAPAGDRMLAALGDRVLCYAACGGSSFKFAPLITRSIAERLTGDVSAPSGPYSPAVDWCALLATAAPAAAVPAV